MLATLKSMSATYHTVTSSSSSIVSVPTNAFLFAGAFAEEGVKLHDSVRSKLLEAQQDISSKMTDFTTLSSSMASTIDEIYANLSYPASATLCSSARFPPATINTHLADAKGQLEEAEKKLRNLQDEWEENVCLEENFRRELASIEKIPGRIDTNPRMISLKEEVEQLVLDNTQALDEIEDVSRFESTGLVQEHAYR